MHLQCKTLIPKIQSILNNKYFFQLRPIFSEGKEMEPPAKIVEATIAL